MRIIISIAIILLISVIGCTDSDKVNVKYIATGSVSAYNLQYLNENGDLIDKEEEPQSAQDQWSYGYIASEGDIVYLSGNYNDINSALKLMILIDGKVYKQSSTKSDTLSRITVSGTIPY